MQHFLLFLCALSTTTIDVASSGRHEKNNNKHGGVAIGDARNDVDRNDVDGNSRLSDDHGRDTRAVMGGDENEVNRGIVLGTVVEGLKSDECCIAECGLGDFLLDAYFAYGADLIESSSELRRDQYTKTHIVSFINCGSFKNDIPKGPITMMQLKSILCGKIAMGRMTLRGSDIKKIIEKSVWHYDGYTSHDEFLQVSGMEMTIDPSKPPGNRLQSVRVSLTSEELQDDDIYYVITSKKMNGYMSTVYGLSENFPFREFTYTILDKAGLKIFNDRGVSKQTDGRIKFQNPSPQRENIIP